MLALVWPTCMAHLNVYSCISDLLVGWCLQLLATSTIQVCKKIISAVRAELSII